MNTAFDPYRKWLGIPQWERPANHYRLLGINLFEDDPDVVEAAADRQMAHIRNYQSGQHSEVSQKILNELSAARVCLLTPEQKKAYDHQLRTELAQKAGQVQLSGPPFGFFVKGAARYFLVQAQRVWTARSVLPAAYLTLGNDVASGGRYRDRLGDLYARLENVAENLGAVATPSTVEGGQPADQPPPEKAAEEKQQQAGSPGMIGRIKAFAQATFYTQRRRALLRKIGQEAYRIDAAASGPAGVAEPVRKALARAEELRHEVLLLAEVPANSWLSPKRLAWIVLAIASILVMLFLWARSVL